MGTDKRYKPINKCLKCPKNMANMSWEQQTEHEEYHRKLDLEKSKQKKLS